LFRLAQNIARMAADGGTVLEMGNDGTFDMKDSGAAAASAAAAASGLPTCAECGASGAGFQKCGQCAVVYYCGVACQKKAWPTHKLECRRLAETAAATESAGSTLDRIDTAQDHKEDGAEHYAAGDYEAAFRYFRAGANEVAPLGAAHGEGVALYMACQNNAAMCQLKLERYTQCIECCDEVLARDGCQVKALLRKSIATEKLGRDREALALFERVLESDPANVTARAFTAELHPDILQRTHFVALEAASDKALVSAIERLRKGQGMLADFESKQRIERVAELTSEIAFIEFAQAKERATASRLEAEETEGGSGPGGKAVSGKKEKAKKGAPSTQSKTRVVMLTQAVKELRKALGKLREEQQAAPPLADAAYEALKARAEDALAARDYAGAARLSTQMKLRQKAAQQEAEAAVNAERRNEQLAAQAAEAAADAAHLAAGGALPRKFGEAEVQYTFRRIEPSLALPECAKCELVPQHGNSVCCQASMHAVLDLGLDFLVPAVKAAWNVAVKQGWESELARCNCPTCARVERAAATQRTLVERLNGFEEELSKGISKMHKKRALALHPDKLRRERTEEDEERLQALYRANDVLTDPERRRAYLGAVSHKQWEIKDAEQQKAVSSKLARLTRGEPNKCTMPKVVSQDSMPGLRDPCFKIGLEWLCRSGDMDADETNRPVENFELEIQRWGSAAPWQRLYRGGASSWLSERLPEGQYLFRARGVNACGAGEWSETSTVHLDASTHSSVVAEYLREQQREVKRQNQAQARVVLRDAMVDYTHRSKLGRLRNDTARAAMCGQLQRALTKAKRTGLGKPPPSQGASSRTKELWVGGKVGDVALLADAEQALVAMAEKAKQLATLKARRADIRQMVADALESDALAEEFGDWLDSVGDEDATPEGGGGGGGGGGMESFTAADRNELFQYVMRAAGGGAKGKAKATAKTKGKKGKVRKDAAVVWKSHGGRMLLVVEALAAKSQLFSNANNAELETCARGLRALEKKLADDAAAEAARLEAEREHEHELMKQIAHERALEEERQLEVWKQEAEARRRQKEMQAQEDERARIAEEARRQEQVVQEHQVLLQKHETALIDQLADLQRRGLGNSAEYLQLCTQLSQLHTLEVGSLATKDKTAAAMGGGAPSDVESNVIKAAQAALLDAPGCNLRAVDLANLLRARLGPAVRGPASREPRRCCKAALLSTMTAILWNRRQHRSESLGVLRPLRVIEISFI
jgi:hypothetical protein